MPRNTIPGYGPTPTPPPAPAPRPAAPSRLGALKTWVPALTTAVALGALAYTYVFGPPGRPTPAPSDPIAAAMLRYVRGMGAVWAASSNAAADVLEQGGSIEDAQAKGKEVQKAKGEALYDLIVTPAIREAIPAGVDLTVPANRARAVAALRSQAKGAAAASPAPKAEGGDW